MTDNITRLKEALEAGPTPGPWTADFLSVKRDEHFTIARLHGTTGKCESEEVNAAYIAAANPAAIRELLERLEQAEKDARRYRWLRDHECNSLHLSRDGDHACNYMTASDWIDNNSNWYDEVPEEELQRMRESNTIWALQIYPHTPVGFNWWHGATLDAAIDAAIASHEAPPADGGGQSGGKTASSDAKCLSGNDSSVVDAGAGQAAIAAQEGGE